MAELTKATHVDAPPVTTPELLPCQEFNEWRDEGLLIWSTNDAVVLAEESPTKKRLWRVLLDGWVDIFYVSRTDRRVEKGLPAVSY